MIKGPFGMIVCLKALSLREKEHGQLQLQADGTKCAKETQGKTAYTSDLKEIQICFIDIDQWI